MSNRNSSNKKITRQLNEIIDSNIQNERFGVSELAYELNMSRSNLHRKIKSVTGESVSQYLRKVRLSKAMELLKEQDYTVSEVAFAVEFGLNLPSKQLIEVVGKIGTLHSNQTDKYAETGLTAIDSKIIKANLIKECYLNMECKVTDEYVTGDHTVFVAEPVFVRLDEDVFVDGKFSEKHRSKQNQVHFGDIVDMWNMW